MAAVPHKQVNALSKINRAILLEPFFDIRFACSLTPTALPYSPFYSPFYSKEAPWSLTLKIGCRAVPTRLYPFSPFVQASARLRTTPKM